MNSSEICLKIKIVAYPNFLIIFVPLMRTLNCVYHEGSSFTVSKLHGCTHENTFETVKVFCLEVFYHSCFHGVETI